MRYFKLLTLLLCIFSSLSLSFASSVVVVNTLAHNPQFFTQGLIIENGFVSETTGQYGKSVLATYKLGEAAQLKLKLSNHYFGEGLSKFQQRYFWLSWKAGTAFEIDATDFSLIKTHAYEGQGWGLTHNNSQLIMSNGSSNIAFKDADSFKTTRTIAVSYKGKPVPYLNELEWVNGYILANIWRDDRIVKIDPKSGEVLKNYDLSELRNYFSAPKTDVLNGIAYDKQHDKLYVTGKNWPVLFEVKLVD